MLFSGIIGQTALKARLIGNVREGRVPHAQLFLGPRGSGNLALALAYAHYLLCEAPGPADACGACPACRQLDRLAHPDLHLAFPIFFIDKKPRTCDHLLPTWREAVLKEPFLDAAMWRDLLNGENKQLRVGVDIALEIQRKLSLKSFSGGRKVMLIWLPELMEESAATKLLKVLEEPQPGTVFLLVGTEGDRLLPTILSRAQLVKVPALAEEDLARALMVRYPDLGREEALACAVRSGGDLLEAAAMAEGSEAELFVLFRDWMRACHRLKAHEAAAIADQFQGMGRERQKGLIRYGLHLVRMSLLHVAGAGGLVRSTGEEGTFVARFAAQLDVRKAAGMRTELETAHQHLERNANPKVLFMDVSYRLHRALRA